MHVLLFTLRPQHHRKDEESDQDGHKQMSTDGGATFARNQRQRTRGQHWGNPARIEQTANLGFFLDFSECYHTRPWRFLEPDGVGVGLCTR